MNVFIIYYITSLGEESNPQQSYYKYDVLPLNYLGKDSPVEIRTPTKGTKNLCATVTPPENNKNIIPLNRKRQWRFYETDIALSIATFWSNLNYYKSLFR